MQLNSDKYLSGPFKGGFQKMQGFVFFQVVELKTDFWFTSHDMRLLYSFRVMFVMTSWLQFWFDLTGGTGSSDAWRNPESRRGSEEIGRWINTQTNSFIFVFMSI